MPTVNAAAEGMTLSGQLTGNDEMCWENWPGDGGQAEQPGRKEAGTEAGPQPWGRSLRLAEPASVLLEACTSPKVFLFENGLPWISSPCEQVI